VARLLIDRGYTLVRPLKGGFEAWVEAGYPVEEL
jgi:rhodanese-related sulfurtransferase